MHKNVFRRALFGIPLVAAAVLAAAPTAAQPGFDLFTIVTVKDEIVIALTDEDISALGGEDVGHIGRAIRTDGEITVWRYAVRKADDGELELAPLHRVSVLGHESLRVEPFTTPLRVVPLQ